MSLNESQEKTWQSTTYAGSMLRSSVDQALITKNRTKQRYDTMMQSSTPHANTNDGIIDPVSPIQFKPKIDSIKLGLHSIS